MFLLEVTPVTSKISLASFMAIATKKKVKAISIEIDKGSESETFILERDYLVDEIIEIDLSNRFYV
jgi:hypothetical protein